MTQKLTKNLQYYKFCLYGFLKNLRFFEAFLFLFLLDHRLNFVQIGLLYSIREISMVFLEIPSGIVADTWGRRRTLVSSFFFYILSFLVFYFAGSFYFFASAMFLFAVGDAFRTGVHKAMIFQYLKLNNWENQKVNYYGHTRSWSQFGTAISALVAGLIIFYSGNYDLIFLYSTIPYFLDMLLVWSYPKYLDKGQLSKTKESVLTKFKDVIKAFLLSFRQLSFIRALSSSTLYTGYYRAVKDYIQPMIKYFALTVPFFSWMVNEQKVAVIVAIIYFFAYLLTSVASRLSGKFEELFSSISTSMNISILVGFSVGIVSGYTFSYGFFIAAILTFIVLLLIENLRKPIGTVLIANLSKDQAMATVLSASSQVKSLIAAVLAPVIGILADLLNPGLAIAIISLLLILLSPLYWLPNLKRMG